MVLLALAFLTPLFFYIPDAALAAVIIMAVTDMINFTMVKHLWTINSTSPRCCYSYKLLCRVNILDVEQRTNDRDAYLWVSLTNCTRVSAAADRPARRRGLAQAKYSVSHHMVVKRFIILALADECRSRRWVWSTVVRRPSEVYDTHRRTKLTAPETISRSRDVVGAHQNSKRLGDLTTPLSGMFAIHGLVFATVNLPTKFEVSYSTNYEDMKESTKCRKWGGLG